MSLRPVDATTAVGRTQDVGRQIHQREAETAAAQQNLAAGQQRRAERQQTQVTRGPQAQEAAIRYRRERQREQAGREHAGTGAEAQEPGETGSGTGPALPPVGEALPGEKGRRLDIKL